MRQWTESALIQVKACHLVSTKPLLEAMLTYYKCTLRNKLQWNSNQNTTFSIHENAFGNIVCEMATILSKGRWLEMKIYILGTVMNSSWYGNGSSITVFIRGTKGPWMIPLTKGQQCGALAFSMLLAWTSSLPTTIRVASDFRRHDAYVTSLMWCALLIVWTEVPNM